MGNKNKKNRATEVLRRLVSTLRGAFRKVNLFFPNSPIINQCIVYKKNEYLFWYIHDYYHLEIEREEPISGKKRIEETQKEFSC